jgi:hypothetical protein
MGIYCRAILAHPFDNADILSLPERLNTDQEMLGKAMAKIHDFMKREGFFVSEDETLWHWHDPSKEWNGNDPDVVWFGNNGKYIWIEGPGSISINFGRETCHLHMPFKWMRFQIESVCRDVVRSVCHGVAHAFSGSKAIYLPSSYDLAFDLVYEGSSLQQIGDWLLQNHGEPAPLLKGVNYLTLHYDEYVGGYFIDDFADLKLES